MTQKEQKHFDGPVTFSKILENRPIAFVEHLRRIRAEARGSRALDGGQVGDDDMPFSEQLKRICAEAHANDVSDPWRLRLERVRGKVGDDDVERIASQSLFDILEVPQRSRNAGACRRLAKLMRELGWSPIKARGLTPGGFRDQVRGWARDTRGSPLS